MVWANKSNGQLCVTIPHDSGIKEGDTIQIEKENIQTIVYTPVTADLFHYGHLRLLEAANRLGQLHICGVLTDKVISSYKHKPIAGFKERSAIVSSLRCVDMVLAQQNLDPTENLKKIYEQFNRPKIILVYGSNWKTTPGGEFIKKIKGKVIQPPFYSKLSTQNIVSKIIKIYNLKKLVPGEKMKGRKI